MSAPEIIGLISDLITIIAIVIGAFIAFFVYFQFAPVIRLFNCRSYWLKKLDGEGYEEVEVCRGFEIVPHGFPGGPIG